MELTRARSDVYLTLPGLVSGVVSDSIRRIGSDGESENVSGTSDDKDPRVTSSPIRMRIKHRWTHEVRLSTTVFVYIYVCMTVCMCVCIDASILCLYECVTLVCMCVSVYVCLYLNVCVAPFKQMSCALDNFRLASGVNVLLRNEFYNNEEVSLAYVNI